MKRHVLGILLVMQAILCPLLCSCSNNECLDLYEGEEIVKQFNEAKISTSAHNTMLENTYASIVESPINLQKASIEDEDELNAFVCRFMKSNREFVPFTSETRGNIEENSTFLFLKQVVLQSNTKARTRLPDSREMEMPSFMNMFLDSFFNGVDFDEVDVDKLNEELLGDIKGVLQIYPDLTEEEVGGLLFVAGVTYNSCIYWSENSEKWEKKLVGTETRANPLWEGVKNGVKKWAYADGSGAAQAWLANELMGVATAGMSVLAGAAVGSAWGAIENATTL